jgi:hypothetical protein
VTRYFMTIPEAAQLVLQASLLPELRGRIAMLEMGEPVRILDLARTLVRLSGGGRADESIVFTGLRPGEKLHEELAAPGEHASATSVSKVRILNPDTAQTRKVIPRLPRWDRLIWLGETDPVVTDLFHVVPERRTRMSRGARRKSDATAQMDGEFLSAGDQGNGNRVHASDQVNGNGVHANGHQVPDNGAPAHGSRSHIADGHLTGEHGNVNGDRVYASGVPVPADPSGGNGLSPHDLESHVKGANGKSAASADHAQIHSNGLPSPDEANVSGAEAALLADEVARKLGSRKMLKELT